MEQEKNPNYFNAVRSRGLLDDDPLKIIVQTSDQK